MPLRNPVFVGCDGQGHKSVFPHAGRPYWDAFPEFREKLYQAEKEWFPNIRVIHLAVFEDDQKKLVPTEVAQPLAYTLALGVAEVFKKRREKAFRRTNTVFGGSSVGTGAALALAGAYGETSETFCANMIGERSALMHQACQNTKGKMVVLIIHPDTLPTIEEICAQYGVEIGNHNSPSQIVLTGPTKWVNRAVSKLKEKKLGRAIPLLTEGAFHHSELMAPVVDPLRAWLEKNMPAFEVRSPVVGNQGQIISSPEDAMDELANGIAQRSNFNAAMETAFMKLRAKHTIECGPAKVIEGMVTDYRKNMQQSPYKWRKRIALGITVATAAVTLLVGTAVLRESE